MEGSSTRSKRREKLIEEKCERERDIREKDGTIRKEGLRFNGQNYNLAFFGGLLALLYWPNLNLSISSSSFLLGIIFLF